jgi:hypothetical protein
LDTQRRDPAAEGVAVQGRISQTGEKAMKAAVLAFLPMLAVAQEMPLIVGTIPNRDNNRITFTTYKGECNGNDKVVYTQADGGKVSAVGCYRIVGDSFFVVWAENDIYTYRMDDVTLSPEMEAFLNRQQ